MLLCTDAIIWGYLSGISWVFERKERAIILEDDCVPDITFF